VGNVGAIILGGTGYGAGELLRYLSFHPEVQVTQVVSSSAVGADVASSHEHLRGFYDGLRFTEGLNSELFLERNVVFSSLPHGTSSAELQKIADTHRSKNLHFVDLSGDLRLQDEGQHLCYYSEVPFNRDFRELFSYSIPELGRPPKQHISNPGCLSTASILALWPLRNENVVGSIVVDAKTGTSGAGRSPQASMHHPRRDGNCEAYKVLAHRHEPEIAQGAALGGKPLIFVPHLLPTSRGILVTCYLTLESPRSYSEVHDKFSAAYSGKGFIRIRTNPPALSEVVGTNFCDISFHVRNNQVVISAAIDNLGKGMAGQAIQNMNLLLGFDEGLGLKIPALGI